MRLEWSRREAAHEGSVGCPQKAGMGCPRKPAADEGLPSYYEVGVVIPRVLAKARSWAVHEGRLRMRVCRVTMRSEWSRREAAHESSVGCPRKAGMGCPRKPASYEVFPGQSLDESFQSYYEVGVVTPRGCSRKLGRVLTKGRLGLSTKGRLRSGHAERLFTKAR